MSSSFIDFFKNITEWLYLGKQEDEMENPGGGILTRKRFFLLIVRMSLPG
jgi:hypothetical protein